MPLLHTVVKREPATATVVHVLSRAKLPTRHGQFEIVAFRRPDGEPLRDIAVVKGEVTGAERVPVRVHSECLTGDVLGSLRCDCGEQLEVAMQRIADADTGIVLYMRQEGRGIGIANKVRAYALQDQGLDTVDANEHLGFDDDLRSYGLAAAMLQALDVRSIELHTNNPKKVDGLREQGIDVVDRVPLAIAPRDENRQYLLTKHLRSGHLLDDVE